MNRALVYKMMYTGSQVKLSSTNRHTSYLLISGLSSLSKDFALAKHHDWQISCKGNLRFDLDHQMLKVQHLGSSPSFRIKVSPNLVL